MLKIITDDKRAQFVADEVQKELKNADGLCGEYFAEKCEKGLFVEKRGHGGRIGYSDLRSLARAITVIAQRIDEDSFEVYQEPRYDILGAMADVSRNAVMTVESVKKLCRISAIEGFNALMLYTEDTYEVEGYEYFGHLRGRYTPAELREMDDYADALGIELIPCIQTLAHLNAFFEWPSSAPLRDCDDIMFAGDEKVYALVDKMLLTMSQNLRSKKINIGLDEAHMLGCGRYLDKNGYVRRSDIMAMHLARVIELCKKHGYEPRMWSDMFFRMINEGVYRVMGTNVPQHIIDSVPPETTLVYWEYIQTNQANYDEMFRQHKAFKNPIAFAGGDASWYGLVPLNRLARESSLAAVKSIEKNETKEIYFTMWGDDGAACSFFSTLSTLFIYGEACWESADSCDLSARERLGALLGLDYDTLLDVELINNVPNRKLLGKVSCAPTRYMLYSNVLMGKFDAHVPAGTDRHFAAQAERWHAEAENNGEYGYIFKSFAALCDVLAIKAEMGIRMYNAYHENDRETLEHMCEVEIDELIRRVEVFHDVFRAQWLKENKAFGFDVHDIRLGGLIGQLKSAKVEMRAYLDGERDAIEELEAPRIPYMSSGAGYDNGSILVNRWERIAAQDISNMYGY